MRLMRINTSPAFTIIEVLIVSPLIVLMIGAFIGAAVTLTGEALRQNEQTTIAFETQAALDEVEQDIVQATSFRTVIAPPSPQGSNDALATFTNTTGTSTQDNLIIRQPTTDKDPNDPTRQLVYTGTPCDSNNPLFETSIVYFLKDNSSNSNTKSLYRRTILQSGTSCLTPWQRPSCTSQALNTTVCKADDEKLLDYVTTFDVKYYNQANSVDPPLADSEANAAASVAVQISVSKTSAGKALNYSGSMRATSINYQQADGS